MSFEIGQKVELNGEEYTIVGTVKRSFKLEKDGKFYKATANMMNRIQDHNAGRKVERKTRSTGTRYMKKRLEWMNLWSKTKVTMPTTDAEFEDWAEQIACDLSPENLHCDGEISASQARAKYRNLRAELKELEQLAGRTFELVY